MPEPEGFLQLCSFQYSLAIILIRVIVEHVFSGLMGVITEALEVKI